MSKTLKTPAELRADLERYVKGIEKYRWIMKLGLIVAFICLGVTLFVGDHGVTAAVMVLVIAVNAQALQDYRFRKIVLSLTSALQAAPEAQKTP